MDEKILSSAQLKAYESHLQREEKSAVTVEKYLRDVRAFFVFIGERAVTKALVVAYKQHLQEKCYAIRSINSMLAGVNSFLQYMEWGDLRVRSLKVQRQVYAAEEKELTKGEYDRLLRVAEKDGQLHLILQTLCASGIRVSELQYFTVEGAEKGEIVVSCKGKSRTILLPTALKRRLLRYAKERRIQTGVLFLGKSGKPLDRRTIWAKMKGLCKAAGVQESKVFPHNLRKLFARTFYGMVKDIAALADILGHSSIDTTRIYIMTTGQEHRKLLERLGLV